MAEVGPVTRDVYDSLAAWRRADEGRGDLLLLVSALVGNLEELRELVGDSDTHLGWGRLLDVDAAPEWALEWLAQFVGVTPLRGLSADAQRLRIKEAGGFKRGSPAAIRAAAQQFLTGKRQVEIYERDGSPWRFRIRTYLAETPNAKAVFDAVMALKPAGLVFIHEVQQGLTIDAAPGTIDGSTATIEAYSNTTPLDEQPSTGAYGRGPYGRGPYGGNA